MVRSLKLRLFITTFLALFLELTLIRWIPAHLRFAGYFSNLLLLASFFGLGIGLLLKDKFPSLLPFTPLPLLLLLSLASAFNFDLKITSSSAIFFQDLTLKNESLEITWILPLIFIIAFSIFIPLGQQLGRCFKSLKPLPAYTIDLLGSLSGIVFFTLASFLSLSPLVWFIFIFILFFLLMPPLTHSLSIIALFFCLLCLTLVFIKDHSSLWSPYNRLTIDTFTNLITNQQEHVISANNISHQYISSYKTREPFYHAPYDLFPDHNYQSVLIIGAGTGADVATALGRHPNLKSLDAVEIDPKIISLGKSLNPDHPFSDPRVHLHLTDGRHFLQTTPSSYDLIIFALPDSLVLTTLTSNIRLESFLFTKEAFDLAKSRLNPTGILTTYNYYREQWLIDKIGTTLTTSFSHPPLLIHYGQTGKAAAFFISPSSLAPISTSVHTFAPTNSTLTTDDWPFLYLKNHSLPPLYLKFIASVIIICLLTLLLTRHNSLLTNFDFPLFFAGAGFLLIETKSLVHFSLLFGNTWITNSLVFTAILSLSLLANLLSPSLNLKKPLYLFLPLLASLSGYFIPPTTLVALPLILRYLFSSLLYLSPIFFAGLVFSHKFKSSPHPKISLASNLLGAITGGLTEYAALIIGYKLLTIPLLLFYSLAIFLKRK